MALSPIIETLGQPYYLFMQLFDLVVKSSLLIAFAGVVLFVCKRASASLRHLVWSIALICLLAFPLLNVFLPRLSLPVLPTPPGIEAINDSGGSGLSIIDSDGAILKELNQAIPSVGAIDASAVQIPSNNDQKFMIMPHWTFWLILLWLAGFVYRFTWFAIRLINSIRMIRSVDPVEDLIRETTGKLAAQIGMRANVRIHVHKDITGPLSFGLFGKYILLPESHVTWNEAELRSVLLHELAHLKRRDSFTELVSQLAICFFWFHPLVWLAHHCKFVEMEYACDDFVLREGIRPSEYANHLVNLIGVDKVDTRLEYVTAFSMRKHLFSRMKNILKRKVTRSDAGKRLAIPLVVSLVAVFLIVAAVEPWTAETFDHKSDFDGAAQSFKNKDYRKAANHFKTILTLHPEDKFSWRWLGCAYRYSGENELALAAYSRSKKSGYCEKYADFLIACCYARMGKNDLAMTFLESSLKMGITYEEFTDYLRNFESVKNDPRFKELLNKSKSGFFCNDFGGATKAHKSKQVQQTREVDSFIWPALRNP